MRIPVYILCEEGFTNHANPPQNLYPPTSRLCLNPQHTHKHTQVRTHTFLTNQEMCAGNSCPPRPPTH